MNTHTSPEIKVDGSAQDKTPFVEPKLSSPEPDPESNLGPADPSDKPPKYTRYARQPREFVTRHRVLVGWIVAILIIGGIVGGVVGRILRNPQPKNTVSQPERPTVTTTFPSSTLPSGPVPTIGGAQSTDVCSGRACPSVVPPS